MTYQQTVIYKYIQDSDEDEIAFDDSAKVGQVVAEQPVLAKAPVEEVKAAEVINSDGEAEEIDIDDIQTPYDLKCFA